MQPSSLFVACLLLVWSPSAVFGQRRPLLALPQLQPQPQLQTLQPELQPRPLQYQQQFQGPQQAGAQILGQVSDINPDGSFYTKYETSNGISYEEQGQLQSNGQVEAERVVGSASWTDNEGQRFTLTWQADENGVNFQGDHLPQPPPVPEAIQRALAWIAANPGRDGGEGQYREQDYENRGRLVSPQPLGTTQQQQLSRRPGYPSTPGYSTLTPNLKK